MEEYATYFYYSFSVKTTRHALCLVVSVVISKVALVHSTKDMLDYITVKELIFMCD